MQAITKGPEPTALRAYRAVPGATYDGKDFTPVKVEIRRDLLRDQLALCCYCMRRISDEKRPHPTNPEAPPLISMKVEHWQSQYANTHLQLTWINMLGACLGGVAVSQADETCDTRKGEDKITLDPLDRAHVATLRCSSAGRLESTNAQFQGDIDDRLNLNHKILVADRKAMLERDLGALKFRYRSASIPESAVRALIDAIEAPSDGKAREHCGVLRLWARKRFGGRLG